MPEILSTMMVIMFGTILYKSYEFWRFQSLIQSDNFRVISLTNQIKSTLFLITQVFLSIFNLLLIFNFIILEEKIELGGIIFKISLLNNFRLIIITFISSLLLLVLSELYEHIRIVLIKRYLEYLPGPNLVNVSND